MRRGSVRMSYSIGPFVENAGSDVSYRSIRVDARDARIPLTTTWYADFSRYFDDDVRPAMAKKRRKATTKQKEREEKRKGGINPLFRFFHRVDVAERETNL